MGCLESKPKSSEEQRQADQHLHPGSVSHDYTDTEQEMSGDASSGQPIVVANKAEFDDILKNAGSKPVLIDFHATWCGPCRVIGPVFIELSKEYAGKVVTCKIDVDEADDVAAECGINAMPTFQVYKDGKKIDEQVGASTDKLKSLFAKHGA